MSRNHLAAAGVFVLVAGCSFGAINGFAQLADDRAAAILSVDDEGDRVYVGTYTSGDRWDATAKITAYNSSTGASTGTTSAWTGTWKTRAVSTDPNDTSVWTLHDTGHLVNWPRDLGTWSSYDLSVFAAPSGHTLERMCDLEVLDDELYLATGISSDNGSDYGFFQLVEPNPSGSGAWRRSTTYTQIDIPVAEGASCPRIAVDPFDADRFVVLWPERTLTGGPQVDIYEQTSSVSGGLTYQGYSWTGDSITPSDDTKHSYTDVATTDGGVVLAYSYLYGVSSGESMVIYLDDGSFDTATGLPEVAALDIAGWVTNTADYLWWSGEEDETGSTFELGTIRVTSP